MIVIHSTFVNEGRTLKTGAGAAQRGGGFRLNQPSCRISP
jgi:hypothetical protein